ncbi:hypothetical protein RVIR1_05060 [Candidatus Rickettsiella viridis]|uniref:Uncharacterized protein n=1 Tax=Candidatus Rickettsiella viridis TaxID=676208 RepID=A0A2Z5UVG1_9COXI|nr:hypothetical protein RVIR1_05060 [Candidatus Rickettsiella viridis]
MQFPSFRPSFCLPDYTHLQAVYTLYLANTPTPTILFLYRQ